MSIMADTDRAAFTLEPVLEPATTFRCNSAFSASMNWNLIKYKANKAYISIMRVQIAV